MARRFEHGGNDLHTEGLRGNPGVRAAAWAWFVALIALQFSGGLVTSLRSGGSAGLLGLTSGSEGAGAIINIAHQWLGVAVLAATLGLCALLMVSTQARATKVLGASVLGALCANGVLGWLSVTWAPAESAASYWGLAHGILAIGVLGIGGALLIALEWPFRRWRMAPPQPSKPELWRRAFGLATALLVLLFVQATFGAVFRHVLVGQAAVAHVALAVVIVSASLATGFTLTAAQPVPSEVGRSVRRVGWMLSILTIAQALLGAFALWSREWEVFRWLAVLMRTAHQTNGALVAATAAGAWVLCWRFAEWPKRSPRLVGRARLGVPMQRARLGEAS